jgi:outer membrane protein assembly factor BamB
VDGYVYGYSNEVRRVKGGGWTCQDFETGKKMWSKNLHLPGRERWKYSKGSLIYADGNLYCYHDTEGDMLLLKATSAGYQERGRFRIPEHTAGWKYQIPVVANGKLYLRDQNLIFCYDVRKPQIPQLR